MLVPACAAAEEAPPSSDRTDPGVAALDRPHAAMSSLVEGFLQRADALFSGPGSYDAPTGSYVVLGGKATLRRERDGGSELSPITRAKIRLPGTERRLELLIERGIAGTTSSDAERDAQAAAGQVAPDNNAYLALRALAADTLKLQLTADVGVRVRSSPYLFVRLHAYRLFSAGAWQIPVAETLLWKHDEGFSAATQLGFARDLAPAVALGFASNATWRENLGGFNLSQTASLAWRIDERSLAALQLGAYGTSVPELHDTAYSVAVSYRRKMYKDWLVLELRPEVVYPRDRDFRAVPFLVVQLEAYFGGKYLKGIE